MRFVTFTEKPGQTDLLISTSSDQAGGDYTLILESFNTLSVA